MKASVVFAILSLPAAYAVEAQLYGNSTIYNTLPVSTISSCPPTQAVFITFPVSTISSCPPTQTVDIFSFVSTSSSSTPTQAVYTTVNPQPKPDTPSDFVPVTYTITEPCPCTIGSRTGIPPGFTTATITVRTITTVITCPTASITGYVDSGFMSQPPATTTVPGGSNYQTENTGGSPTGSSPIPQSSGSSDVSNGSPDSSTGSNPSNGSNGSDGQNGSNGPSGSFGFDGSHGTSGANGSNNFSSVPEGSDSSAAPTASKGSDASSSQPNTASSKPNGSPGSAHSSNFWGLPSANRTSSSTMAIYTGAASKSSLIIGAMFMPVALLLAHQAI